MHVQIEAAAGSRRLSLRLDICNVGQGLTEQAASTSGARGVRIVVLHDATEDHHGNSGSHHRGMKL